jgi:hypothetical protein
MQLEFYSTTNQSAVNADMSKLQVATTVVYVPVTRLNLDDAPPPLVPDATQEASVTFTVPTPPSPGIAEVKHRDTEIVFRDALTTLDSMGASVQFVWAPIKVRLVVTDNTPTQSGQASLEKIRLYYAVTEKTVTTPPALGIGFPATNPTGYTLIRVCDRQAGPACTAPGGVYTPEIPAQEDKRVWFVIVVDDQAGGFGGGNFTVMPPQETTSSVTYVYDQDSGCGIC